MTHQVRNDSMFAKQDAGASNFHHGTQGTPSFLPLARKPSAWDSPAFEEFDLCMEVTAYVHQWE